MEIDTVYENVGHNESEDTRGRNNKDGKEQRGRVCLVLMTVILGLICVLLLVFIIRMNIIITAEREEHETTVQEFKNSCWFFMSSEAKNWSDSRQFCRDRGADVVTIKTEEKQKFISSLVQEMVWIGLTDTETEGTMKWVDNTTLNKTQGFFHYGEPNNAGGDEDCVSINYFSGTLENWNDQPCSEINKVICEKHSSS